MILQITIQVILFIVGAILLGVDSGGYKENMTWVSYFGIGLCILGIGFTFIKGGIQLLINKFKK